MATKKKVEKSPKSPRISDAQLKKMNQFVSAKASRKAGVKMAEIIEHGASAGLTVNQARNVVAKLIAAKELNKHGGKRDATYHKLPGAADNRQSDVVVGGGRSPPRLGL